MKAKLKTFHVETNQNGSLILHSNEIGDSVGTVKSVKNIKYLTNEQ